MKSKRSEEDRNDIEKFEVSFSGYDWHLECCEITLILWYTVLILIMPYIDMLVSDVYMFDLFENDSFLWWPCDDTFYISVLRWASGRS